MRRVVVTGIGVVAPNGNTARDFWSSCANGKTGIDRISSFDTTGFPTNIAGEVRGFDVVPFCKDRRMLKLLNRRRIHFERHNSLRGLDAKGRLEAPPSARHATGSPKEYRARIFSIADLAKSATGR